MSFGPGKTLDGGGGGALLTDDANLAATLSRRIASWPIFDSAVNAVEDHVVLPRRHLGALAVPAGGEILLPIEAAHCRHRFDESWGDRLACAIEAFRGTNAAKMHRLERWQSALARAEPKLSAPKPPIVAAWRAVFRAQDGILRDRIVAALRGAGFDAGTNYPPLWDGAPKALGNQRAIGGDAWGATVLTLWLGPAYDDARIRAGADIIQRTIEERAS